MTTKRSIPDVRTILAALMLLQAVACGAGSTTQPAPATQSAVTFATVRMTLKDKAFTIEVADTEAKREQGLMDRQSLADDAGMIFVFSEPDYWSFWMHNTNIPLDLVYLDAEGKVVDIKPLKPHDETGVTPREKALYALELNSGTCKKLGLTVGDKITLPEKLAAIPDAKNKEN